MQTVFQKYYQNTILLIIMYHKCVVNHFKERDHKIKIEYLLIEK